MPAVRVLQAVPAVRVLQAVPAVRVLKAVPAVRVLKAVPAVRVLRAVPAVRVLRAVLAVRVVCHRSPVAWIMANAQMERYALIIVALRVVSARDLRPRMRREWPDLR